MSQLYAPTDPHTCTLDKRERRKGKALVICGIILQHFVLFCIFVQKMVFFFSLIKT